MFNGFPAIRGFGDFGVTARIDSKIRGDALADTCSGGYMAASQITLRRLMTQRDSASLTHLNLIGQRTAS